MRKHFQSAILAVLSMGCFSHPPVDGFYKGKGNYEAVPGGGFSCNGKCFAGTDKVSLTRNVVYANLFLAAGITDKLPYGCNEHWGRFQELIRPAKFPVLL